MFELHDVRALRDRAVGWDRFSERWGDFFAGYLLGHVKTRPFIAFDLYCWLEPYRHEVFRYRHMPN